MSEQKTYSVQGMTCEHCKLSVTQEILEVPGVGSVDVDLPSGRVIVRGDALEDAAVVDAVENAGYRVAS